MFAVLDCDVLKLILMEAVLTRGVITFKMFQDKINSVEVRARGCRTVSAVVLLVNIA